MENFTPMSSLVGGALIGLAAAMLMIGYGRIAGASGLLAGVVFPQSKSEMLWRAIVIASMIASAPLLAALFGIRPNVVPPVSLVQVAIGGLIVGVGGTLGSGCTSGHGICGLARFSVRSLVAVVSFMVTAFVSVFVLRHVVGG